jgi:hypothetical protein
MFNIDYQAKLTSFLKISGVCGLYVSTCMLPGEEFNMASIFPSSVTDVTTGSSVESLGSSRFAGLPGVKGVN